MITERDVWTFLHKVRDDDSLRENVNPRDMHDSNLCLYSQEGKHCIVGYWFANEVGVSDDFFDMIEGTAADIAIDTAMEMGIIEAIEPQAVDTLRLVQEYADLYNREHDMPTTWGEAITKIYGD